MAKGRLKEDYKLNKKYLISVTAGDIDSESATDGQVLIADGSSGTSWETHPFIAPAYKTPANINVVTGGTPVGSVTDMQTAFDGNVYNLPEATGAPGIDLEINFTGVTGIKGLVFAGRYVGSSTHYIDIYLYDYNAAADQAIFRMQTQSGSPATTNEYRTILIPDDSNFIDGSGNTQISFIHPVTGNSSHDLYLDYIALLN